MLFTEDAIFSPKGNERHDEHRHIAAVTDAVQDYPLNDIDAYYQADTDQIGKIRASLLSVKVGDVPAPVLLLSPVHNNNSFIARVGFLKYKHACVCQVLLSIL